MKPRVVMACFDQSQLLDMAGPIDCFDIARSTNPGCSNADYEIVLVSHQGGLVKTSSGVSVDTVTFADLEPSDQDTLMISGGTATTQNNYPDLTRHLQRFAPKVKRICSVCTGAFILAQSGLADQRKLATHWRFTEELQSRFPGVSVESDAIFCRDGNIWSSAGITAGIDMTLAILEEDLGSLKAQEIAKDIVVYIRRPGGQSQFSQILDLNYRCEDQRFGDLLVWIQGNLDKSLTVERLAEELAMSPRNFARKCKQEMNETPSKLVEKIRLESARRLIENNHYSFANVAARCGFGREETMRRSFQRYLKTTPLLYRQHHQSRDAV